MVAASSHTGTPLPPTPLAYLVARQRLSGQRTWDVEIPERGLWRLCGSAGAGLSSFLIDTALHAIASGVDPSKVLVLTASKESAARLRLELSDRLADSGYASNAPLVRSVHSLAFALVREASDDPVRLISGAEQDSVFRQLLEGHHEDGRGAWPAELRPALPLVGFARQLRDFLLRAVERELDAAALGELGRRHNRPVWVAAAAFLREYQQVMALSGTHYLSASELVARAARMPIDSTWHTVLVDDAQNLDPASAHLVTRLLDRARLGVVAGDPGQAVFHFRGASPKFYRTLGGLDHLDIDVGSSRRSPQRAVVVADAPATQDAVVVDRIRRAHLEDGVAYRDMAVVVRSTGMLEPMRRALLHAGVPAALNPTDVVLSQQRIVASLLLGLRALYEELSSAEWRDLLLGPVGGSDPVTLRRLLRGLRRWEPQERAENSLRRLLVMRGELPDFGDLLTERELDILNHTRKVLVAGRTAAEEGSVEEVLWALWSATDLSNRLLAIALRGGATGSQADRDLDAVMALFDAAGDFTERRASAGIESFVTYIQEQVLPTGVRDRRTATPDAVSLLTAHGVSGKQFRLVVVAGVQEQSWPSLGETGTMFGQEDLIDLVDHDVDPALPVSHKGERLKEERRLFHVATTRATEHLLVTAVEDLHQDDVVEPSRFLEEFAATHDLEVTKATTEDFTVAGDNTGAKVVPTLRVLARDELIAELRRALTASDSDEATRAQAARQLARLTDAGVAGADPGQWWTAKGASTSEALNMRDRLSPSRIESLLECPMRSVLERMVGLDSSPNIVWGKIAHAYLEAIALGVDPDEALRLAMQARQLADDSPPWKTSADLAEYEAMLHKTRRWLDTSRSAFEQVAVEAEVDVQISPDVRIVGRVDRLERDGSGALHVVDLKTGKSAPSKEKVEENPQLEAYQLALSRGVVKGKRVETAGAEEQPAPVGGGVLLYPNSASNSAKVLQQSPKDPERLRDFEARINPLPAAMTGPQLTARTGSHCERCGVRALCPVQKEGQVTTHV
ncbi:ATP-dependent DNA helicase [Corynebacterium mayonis]|uniref:ATP-dependent DNA helicase n=1 Tax=Corynebacterium mayonis TaxID=3062461 RepID=UPI003140B08A